jgi:hypothetical protein
MATNNVENGQANVELIADELQILLEAGYPTV